MSLQKSHSLVRAEHVISLIQNSDEGQYVDGFIDAYQNGREQGFLIYGFDPSPGCGKALYIAEHRNVDDIVVYYGEFAMQSISEDAYRHKNFFKTEREAADFIIDLIKPLTAERRKRLAEWIKEDEAKQKKAKKGDFNVNINGKEVPFSSLPKTAAKKPRKGKLPNPDTEMKMGGFRS